MPIVHTKKGWFWGSKGPFPNREKAVKVAQAIFASGWREKNPKSDKRFYVYFRGTRNGEWIEAENLNSAKWILALKHGLYSISYVAGTRKPLKNPLSLYEAFHRAKPKSTRVVNYTNPKGTLIKIGRLSEIKYKPEYPSKHVGTEFYHKSGDTGDRMLKSNMILATDSKGKNLYLIKDKKTKYPVFTGRGIIG